MESFYLIDTCIWRDFYEDRMSKSGKPIGKYATDLFMKILKKKDKILFSEALMKELSKDYKKEDINDMLTILLHSEVLVPISITKDEFLEAKQVSEKRDIPLIDCLNVIQARNHKATMVTRDKHYFKNLKDIVKSLKPEDIT